MFNRIKSEFLNAGLKLMNYSVDDKIVRIFFESASSHVNNIVILPAVKIIMKRLLSKLRNKSVHGRIYNGLLNNVPVSIIRSFVGCPNMAITMECLKRTKANILLRVDFCGGINTNEEIDIGETLIPKTAYCGDGTSPHYINLYRNQIHDLSSISNPFHQLGEVGQGTAKTFFAEANNRLKDILFDTGCSINPQKTKLVNLWTTDALFSETPDFLASLASINVQAIDMESSILFLLGKFFNLKTVSILSVSDLPGNSRYDLFKSNEIHPELENGINRTLEILMQSLPKIRNDMK